MEPEAATTSSNKTAMTPQHTPPLELLAPAGDMEKLETAILYGADAVYLGGPDLSLRAAAAGFDRPALEQALALAHAAGVQVYYCLNVLARPRELAATEVRLDEISDLALDGIIVADLGVARLARQKLPHLPLHASTQANTMNVAAARAWADLGATRVNLARELSGRDIRDIAKHEPGLELEVFAHGAMCLALSGQCLLSTYLNGRSANRGACTHPCRFEYREMGLVLEEKLRPGEDLWELQDSPESADFSKLLAREDLCLLPYVRFLARAGVRAAKIEGRTKSSAYLCQVVDAYATMIRGPRPRRSSYAQILAEAANAASRPLSSGFFVPRRRTLALPPETKRPVLGRVLEALGPEAWLVQVKARWQALDPVDVLVPGLVRPRLSPGTYALEGEDGHGLTVAHPGARVVLRGSWPQIRPGFFLRQA